jgi:hypothetical protein
MCINQLCFQFYIFEYYSKRSRTRDEVGALWPPYRRTHLRRDMAGRSLLWRSPFTAIAPRHSQFTALSQAIRTQQ